MLASWRSRPDRTLRRGRPDGSHSVNRVRFTECKGRHFNVESVALRRHHLIRSMHRAERRLERAARGVFERLTWVESWLLTDDAKSPNLLDAIFGIGDGPVSTDQLDGIRALVGDLDRVEKKPEVAQRFRSRLGVAGRDVHTNTAGDRLRSMHAALGWLIAHAR